MRGRGGAGNVAFRTRGRRLTPALIALAVLGTASGTVALAQPQSEQAQKFAAAKSAAEQAQAARRRTPQARLERARSATNFRRLSDNAATAATTTAFPGVSAVDSALGRLDSDAAHDPVLPRVLETPRGVDLCTETCAKSR
jgi:hypothetical protein